MALCFTMAGRQQECETVSVRPMQATTPSTENRPPSPDRAPLPIAWHTYLRMGVCVFVAGAAVMIYQFLAVRILARFFGSTMDVWASEIAVCMAGLSLGYFAGGLLADHFRALWPMGAALVVAGLSALAIEPVAVWCGERLLHSEAALQWHPLIAAAASSFVPFVALGTVLPQAVRMAASERTQIGSAAGCIAALSTFGSIVGVLAIGHYLLAHWPVLHVLHALSALLIVLGIGLSMDAAVRRPRRAVLALLCGGLLAMPAFAQTVVFQQYTAHQHVLVVDSGNSRGLLFDNDVQSTMSLRDPYQGGLEYTDYFHVPMLFKPAISRVCFIGLGGGTGPKAFLRDYPRVTVEVAEIDPVVERVARQYFQLPSSPRLQVVIQDGRAHLNRSRGQFGAIFMDAYAGGPYGAYLPAHLATREFFELAHSRLETGGSFVFNAIGVYGGMNHDVVTSISATLRTVFPVVYAYQARSSLNTVFVAVKLDGPEVELIEEGAEAVEWPEGPFLAHPASPRTLAAMARTAHDRQFLSSPILARRFLQVSRVQRTSSLAPILTDNFAPVDVSPRRR